MTYDPHFIIITERIMSSFSDISLSNTTALKFTNAARLENLLEDVAMLGFGVRTIKTALKYSRNNVFFSIGNEMV